MFPARSFGEVASTKISRNRGSTQFLKYVRLEQLTNDVGPTTEECVFFIQLDRGQKNRSERNNTSATERQMVADGEEQVDK